eukprot:TRINITY_DN50247_c0_g1_i1.p1 TRINITY_DN50247_c0_g1~~TRINITY_DN50247_c0_g1_i1.p1  ORF type:complete len:457 (+),score=114.62 TRINITY_DN50247_c0_g1_i1:142-1512(+)
MSAQPSQPAPAPARPPSLGEVWAATIGDDLTLASDLADHRSGEAGSSLDAKDISDFAKSLESQVKDWAQLFAQVPNDHERRKDALGGALKLKSAAKKFEKLGSQPAEVDSESDKPKLERGLPDVLADCQSGLNEVILGLLEVSFPVHEAVRNDDFKDNEAVTAAVLRLRTAVESTCALGELFAKGRLEPKSAAGSGSEDQMSPEVLKMLEKAVKQQKKKDKKKKGQASSEAPEVTDADLREYRAAWDRAPEGRCSKLLGAEVWEGLNWHRGMFLFTYIKFLVEQREQSTGGSTEEGSAEPPVSRALFVEAMRSFHLMLTAQGPVDGDQENPERWQATSDGPHKDESARMFYHGIYSSMHLRSLKHLSEVSYWQWKHGGKSLADAKLAALLNRKFAHVVRDIMPNAGWTADVEHERALEMEALVSSSKKLSEEGEPAKSDGYAAAAPVTSSAAAQGA